MKKYSRVSYEERCQIFALLQVKTTKSEIARILNRSKSTICRELARNSTQSGIYLPQGAQNKAQIRSRKRIRPAKIQGLLEKLVLDKIDACWSPDLISGRLKLERNIKISHETIYKYIRKNVLLKKKLRFLSKGGLGRQKQRNRTQTIKLSIHKRPKAAKTRSRFGHWERDGMYGANRKQLLVCLERKSRIIRIGFMPKTDSKSVNQLTNELLKKDRVLTITNDNGSEFRKNIKLDKPIYYCDPMKPQQRGSVENVIGTLRLKIKRTTDLESLGQEKIKEIEDLINLRPRKMFNYKTPYEVYYRKSVALVS